MAIGLGECRARALGKMVIHLCYRAHGGYGTVFTGEKCRVCELRIIKGRLQSSKGHGEDRGKRECRRL